MLLANQMQLKRNMAAPSGQWYPCLKRYLYKIHRGSVLLKSWLHILEIKCSYVMAMFVQAFQPSFNYGIDMPLTSDHPQLYRHRKVS